MNQSNMWRKTVFGCFMQIGLYVSRVAFDRFTRKTLERAKFMVIMSALVFWLRAYLAFRLSRLLLDMHAEKSGMSSNSSGKGK